MEKVGKEVLVGRVASKAEMTKKDAKKAIDAMIESIREALANGEKVSLNKFGTFEVVDTKERIAKNFQTGESMTVPAGKRAKCKFAKALKELVKGVK